MLQFITLLTTKKLKREKREHLNGHRDPKVRHEWIGDVREKKNPLLPGFTALQCSSPKFTFGASDAIRLNQDGLLEKT